MSITPTSDPIDLFRHWLKDAEKSEINDPAAACLATLDSDGFPQARMVLVRTIGEKGFAFYTNSKSLKGQNLLSYPKASLCFHWKSLRRQVRIVGSVTTATDAESDAYYHSRPRQSRIGAWASQQSEPLSSRDELLEQVALYDEKFAQMENPPRPPHWIGFWILPRTIEFWQDGEFRLHDRLRYERQKDHSWTTQKLYP
jgi:pyridoxamine 5'-phosphate oxidase